ncbi:MAG: restriction endonuclease subunit S [Anaplasmataceae bacterium]|nr:restriction endonuclease subunit S [Anaplasmataceae bacterium]
MRLNYKLLGEYIRQVDNRNKELKVDLLLGVSIKKKFMPSIANIVGTNMRTYKIIEQKQFAYGPVTSRNGDKISVSLLENHDQAIVSQTYTVFEIIDHNKLDPEYLMMWFRRPEFDRYARFKSHGSAREVFDWEEMCKVELPVPSIEKQREIVKEYNVISDRIKLNENLNQKLEETAQAIYKHWFVDFEFPISKEYAEEIGKPELEGKPYKSSGGEMIYCEELEKEIPRGWKMDNLLNIANYLNGLAMQKFEATEEDCLPVIKIRELNQGYTDSKSGKATLNIPKKYQVENGDVIFSWSGTLKVDIWCGGLGGLNQHLFKVTSKQYPKWFYFLWTKNHLENFIRIADGKKTSMGHIKREDLTESLVIIPKSRELLKMNLVMSKVFKKIILGKLYINQSNSLRELILSKMTKIS